MTVLCKLKECAVVREESKTFSASSRGDKTICGVAVEG